MLHLPELYDTKNYLLYDTWSVTLREEHRLKVFENRVLGRIFGSKRDEVTGGGRKLHSDELRKLCCSSNIIWMIKSRWAGNVARMGEMRNACKVLVGKSEQRRPL
jgi:hypothetical protein